MVCRVPRSTAYYYGKVWPTYGIKGTVKYCMVLKGQYGETRKGRECVLSLWLSLERALLSEEPPARVEARATKIAATT